MSLRRPGQQSETLSHKTKPSQSQVHKQSRIAHAKDKEGDWMYDNLMPEGF